MNRNYRADSVDFFGKAGRRLDDVGGRARSFWQRVTEGIALEHLWLQFRAEARAGFELYSREVDRTPLAGESKGHRVFRIARGFFWALLMKLSPARRVFLLVALVLLFVPAISFQVGQAQIETANFHFVSAALLFVLLALELGDRVTMKRDLEIAREIQRWLVPDKPPEIPSVDIAFATRPANTVAGDYYDAFLLPEAALPPGSANAQPSGKLLIAVADVAGKSMPAALLMATFQASLRTLAATPVSLTQLASGLNRYACANIPEGQRFITAFLAELDLATRVLTYVRAGHNPPLLRRAAGRLEQLDSGGLPLGIKPQTEYESQSVRLDSGDILVVFTDGVVEAENETGDEYGEPRLNAMLSAPPDPTAAATLQRLMKSVDLFVGLARQHDDITCLVLHSK
jgi:phosphoserine phosphatase RsbU/P